MFKIKKKGSRDGKPKKSSVSDSKIPSLALFEQVLHQEFGEGSVDRDKEWKAQELAYEAMEADDLKTKVRLLLEAVEMDRHCVDALLMLAEISSKSEEELIASIEKIVLIGKLKLGEALFIEDEGHFWGMLETRPYMRARAVLAELLWKNNRGEEAIKHYEEMLKLNPGDNQGLRYPLLNSYLTMDRLDDARRLIQEYEEGSAFFSWGLVLERHLSGDLAGALKALKKASKCNPYVEAYLTGKKRLPKELPDYYSPGKEDEAVICAVNFGSAWERHPEALSWLQKNV